MKLEFLCGCVTGEIVDPDNLRTMSSVTLDEESFLICQIHRQRRKNWRGSHMSISNAERVFNEQMEVFGYAEALAEKIPLDVKFATEDKRDNRDPELFYHNEIKGRYIRAGIIWEYTIDEPENGKLGRNGLDLLKRNRGI